MPTVVAVSRTWLNLIVRKDVRLPVQPLPVEVGSPGGFSGHGEDAWAGTGLVEVGGCGGLADPQRRVVDRGAFKLGGPWKSAAAVEINKEDHRQIVRK